MLYSDQPHFEKGGVLDKIRRKRTNGLVAQWLELPVQFWVVWDSIPCEVIYYFICGNQAHGWNSHG